MQSYPSKFLIFIGLQIEAASVTGLPKWLICREGLYERTFNKQGTNKKIQCFFISFFNNIGIYSCRMRCSEVGELAICNGIKWGCLAGGCLK